MTSEEKRQKAQINRLMAKGPIDLPFALLVLLLTAIGVLMVFSASFARAFYEAEDPSAMAALSVFLRQAVFAAAGVVVMFITSKIDYHWWRRWAVPLLGLYSLALLAQSSGGQHPRRKLPIRRSIWSSLISQTEKQNILSLM